MGGICTLIPTLWVGSLRPERGSDFLKVTQHNRSVPCSRSGVCRPPPSPSSPREPGPQAAAREEKRWAGAPRNLGVNGVLKTVYNPTSGLGSGSTAAPAGDATRLPGTSSSTQTRAAPLRKVLWKSSTKFKNLSRRREWRGG